MGLPTFLKRVLTTILGLRLWSNGPQSQELPHGEQPEQLFAESKRLCEELESGPYKGQAAELRGILSQEGFRPDLGIQRLCVAAQTDHLFTKLVELVENLEMLTGPYEHEEDQEWAKGVLPLAKDLRWRWSRLYMMRPQTPWR